MKKLLLITLIFLSSAGQAQEQTAPRLRFECQVKVYDMQNSFYHVTRRVDLSEDQLKWTFLDRELSRSLSFRYHDGRDKQERDIYVWARITKGDSSSFSQVHIRVMNMTDFQIEVDEDIGSGFEKGFYKSKNNNLHVQCGLTKIGMNVAKDKE